MSDKIPDKRATEKMTSDLSRLLQEKNFESEEELKAYLDNMVKDKRIPEASPKSAIDFAHCLPIRTWQI